MESASEKLASFIVGFRQMQLSEASKTTVRRAFLDSFSVTFASTEENVSQIMRLFMRENGCSGDAHVPIVNLSLSAPDAALLLGVMLHALDFDDTGGFTQGHPSAPVFPVIFSLGQLNPKLTLCDALAAYAIGVEVLSRLSRTMPMLHLNGWHPTGVIGSISAAAVAARMIGLNYIQTVHCLGISASLGSGLVENFGTMSKALHAGNAARNGVVAAQLAQMGFSSSREALDGQKGFFFSFFKGEPPIDGLLNDFSELVTHSPGLNIKRHACCAMTHRCIDIAIDMRNVTHTVNSIESIICYSSRRAKEVLFHTNPDDDLQAKFSMNYVVAAALLFGRVTPIEFKKSNMKIVKSSGLMEKILLVTHEDWVDGEDIRPDRLVIRMYDGKVFDKSRQFPKGNAASPLNTVELMQKFDGCLNGVLKKPQRNQLFSFIIEGDEKSLLSNLFEIIR